MTPKEKVLKILESTKGDDLERAELCFKNYSKEDLNKEYGKSGKTCKEIIDEYKKDRDEVDQAIKWVKSL